MSTCPFGNSVAVCPILGMVVLPAETKRPSAGLYRSALPQKFSPSATSTIPFGNRVAEGANLCLVMFPVAVNVPVDTSYSSTLA